MPAPRQDYQAVARRMDEQGKIVAHLILLYLASTQGLEFFRPLTRSPRVWS